MKCGRKKCKGIIVHMNRYENTDVVWNEKRLLHEWNRVVYIENPQCVQCTIIKVYTDTHKNKQKKT